MFATFWRLALALCVFAALCACKPPLTAEQKEQLAALQKEQASIQAEITAATAEDSKYDGGLIKALLAVRLETLKTNTALIQQRIHALEGRAVSQVVHSTAKPDMERAAALAKDIEDQRRKLAEARAESERYAGGLIKSLTEMTAATIGSTLAQLEQERLKAVYGIVLPQKVAAASPAATAPQDGAKVETAAAPSVNASLKDCLKIDSFDSSVLSTNNVYTEVAWKADVKSACSESRNVKVTFTLYDKEDFQLDSDHERVQIAPGSVGKARGKMLVGPPEKAGRMTRQGVSLSY
jgi:hypothetical protein